MDSVKTSLRFILNSQHRVVYLTPSLMNELGCTTGKATISFSNKKTTIQIRKREASGNVLFMPKQIASVLAIPFAGPISAYFKDNVLHVGPVIGILTTNFTGNLSSPYGRRSDALAHYLELGNTEPVYFYSFTPELINWSEETVHAVFRRWNQNTQSFQWVRRKCALPQSIYDRIPAPISERTDKVINTKVKLRSILQTKWFNQGYFNKWNLHRRLMEKGKVNDHIPETASSPTPEQIEHMIDRHKMVYLKPARGSLGIGIIKITKNPGGGYLCRYRTAGQNRLQKYNKISTLLKSVLPGRSRLQGYIIQQGIVLDKYEGRPVDYRVHLHRNGNNEWTVAAVAAKVAGNGSVTTHVRTGGRVIPGRQFIDRMYGSRADEIYQRLANVSIRISEVISESVNGEIGELGLDMGIDKNGRVWMFEANAKPGRSIFKHPSLKASSQQSIKYLLDYGSYLAGFK